MQRPIQLHYIHDPLCGWCYGAEPLVFAAANVTGLPLKLRAGGLFPEPTHLPEEMRRYIQQADGRVAAISGQPYGEAYLSGLLHDPDLVLESRPPIAAVLAARSIGERHGLPMLSAIQHAHYERGWHVVRDTVLVELAVELGLDRDAFETAFRAAPVDAHVEETRGLMRRVGAAGFPTFVLETGDGLQPIAHNRFASSPAEFAAWLESVVAAAA